MPSRWRRKPRRVACAPANGPGARPIPSRDALVLGIDGGGSTTRCVLVSRDGRIVAQGADGSSNPLTVGLEAATAAVEKAARSARVHPASVVLVGAGFAGARLPEDKRAIARALRRLFSKARVAVESDDLVALAGAIRGKPGLATISGTGSITIGVNRRGEILRGGGWGHLIGDEGSAYDIGRRGIILSLKSLDRSGAPTDLKDALFAALGVTNTDELVDLVYRRRLGVADFAALQSIVLRVARRGDPIARKILLGAGTRLGDIAGGVVRKLELQRARFPVAACGGVFRNNSILLGAFRRRLRRVARGARVVFPVSAPALGAVRLAIARAEHRDIFETPLFRDKGAPK